MTKITESAIEEYAIELFEKQGYGYIYAPSIAPDSETQERQSFEDVLLIEQLQTAVGRINSSIPADIMEDAIKQIQRLNSPELIANNEAFHRMLTEGIKVTYQIDGHSRGDYVWLIDFKNPENNDFLVVNQYTIHNTSPSGYRGAKNTDTIGQKKSTAGINNKKFPDNQITFYQTPEGKIDIELLDNFSTTEDYSLVQINEVLYV